MNERKTHMKPRGGPPIEQLNSILIKPTQPNWFNKQNNVFPSKIESHSPSFSWWHQLLHFETHYCHHNPSK